VVRGDARRISFVFRWYRARNEREEVCVCRNKLVFFVVSLLLDRSERRKGQKRREEKAQEFQHRWVAVFRDYTVLSGIGNSPC
jgi:hypothetical protein